MRVRAVLLPPPTTAEVQVVLACRVRIQQYSSLIGCFALTSLCVPRPDVHFHCDIDFDPFLYMEDHNKTYGALALQILKGYVLLSD